MTERKQLEPIASSITIVAVEVDARLHVRIDLGQFLQDRGVDHTTGEPSPEELQTFILETIRQYLRDQSYVESVTITWLDTTYEARALDPERLWRSGVP